MVLVQQDIWGWPIILYLFLGGLGGGGTALLVYYDAFKKRVKKLALWANIIYLVAVVIGIGLLIYDMLQPDKFYLVFSFKNPSWITYGSTFLALYTVFTVLYVAPLALEWNWFNKLVSKLKLKGLIEAIGQSYKAVAVFTILFGLLVAVYTGLLFSVTPAIPFWNNGVMPILFLTSGASTGIGLLLLLERLADDHEFSLYLERTDIFLILAELLMIFALFNTSISGREAARYSAYLLLNDTTFILGVIVFGLIIPLILETFAYREHMKKGMANPKEIMIITGILILMGGLLLRYYIIWAGVFQYPWPTP